MDPAQILKIEASIELGLGNSTSPASGNLKRIVRISESENYRQRLVFKNVSCATMPFHLNTKDKLIYLQYIHNFTSNYHLSELKLIDL